MSSPFRAGNLYLMRVPSEAGVLRGTMKVTEDAVASGVPVGGDPRGDGVGCGKSGGQDFSELTGSEGLGEPITVLCHPTTSPQTPPAAPAGEPRAAWPVTP